MREHRIAAIPADGIGKEVIAAGLEVMKVVEARDCGFRLVVETFPWGSDYYRKHGTMMAEDGLAALRKFDAIYFGAVGDKEIPDHITLWGLRLPICQGFDQYANLRPTPISTGSSSARTARANMPAMAGGSIAACPRRWRPRPRSSPGSASSASCASPSISPARGRAAI